MKSFAVHSYANAKLSFECAFILSKKNLLVHADMPHLTENEIEINNFVEINYYFSADIYRILLRITETFTK